MKNFLLLLFIFSTSTLFAQWEKIYEVENNNLYFLHINPQGKLMVGAERAEIHYQNDNDDFEVSDLQSFGFISDIDFENNEIGYAGGGCYYTFDECLPNTVYKTIDGGESWNLIYKHGSTGVFNSIEVVGEGEIFALSDYEDLSYSSDGGETWSVSKINPDYEYGFYGQLRFLDRNTAFVIGRGGPALSGNYSVLYKSSDGGQTWKDIFNTSLFATNFQDYFFLDAYNIYTTHGNGQIAHTTDGGENWTFFNYTSNTAEFAQKIIFTSAKMGYIISNDQIEHKSYIYKTTDGGQTWNIDYTPESGYVTDIVFEDSENGYAIVDYRKIYKRSGTPSILTDEPSEILAIPNPVHNQLQLSVQDLPLGSYQLTVFNALGQNVLTTDQIYSAIDVQKLMTGVYFLEIRNSESTLVGHGKFVKNP